MSATPTEIMTASHPARFVRGMSRQLMPVLRRLGAALAERYHRRQARIAEHRRLVKLAELSPHCLRDMGYDPETIYYALAGSSWAVLPIRDRRP
jgi:hypothetical protein